ncbi:MAG: hypothetical protein HC838_14570 [Spirulinaceae cyanobacterium RM2_2_10]|nr:hypothetical protein [Spirulinaceae cyanobacterium RM2_2_10]
MGISFPPSCTSDRISSVGGIVPQVGEASWTDAIVRCRAIALNAAATASQSRGYQTQSHHRLRAHLEAQR